MASQISHIIYAQKYLEKYPSTINRDEFILGVTFPDIRRLDPTIKRKDTHLRFEPVDLNFAGLSSFEAGWKFHLYCDMRREEILNNCGIYAIKGTTDFAGGALKLLEDELLYDTYNNWEKLVNYFNNIPAIKTGLSIPPETLAHWYSVVAKYIEKKPDDKSIHIFLSKLPTTAPDADAIIELIQGLRKNKKVVECLKRVLEEIV